MVHNTDHGKRHDQPFCLFCDQTHGPDDGQRHQIEIQSSEIALVGKHGNNKNSVKEDQIQKPAQILFLTPLHALIAKSKEKHIKSKRHDQRKAEHHSIINHIDRQDMVYPLIDRSRKTSRYKTIFVRKCQNRRIVRQHSLVIVQKENGA